LFEVLEPVGFAPFGLDDLASIGGVESAAHRSEHEHERCRDDGAALAKVTGQPSAAVSS
jgi:hypothetical protein